MAMAVALPPPMDPVQDALAGAQGEAEAAEDRMMEYEVRVRIRVRVGVGVTLGQS